MAMQAGIPVLGMTATPCRAEPTYGFEPLFTMIIAGPNYRELAEQGYLKPMRVILGGGISTTDAGSRDGDWNLNDIERANTDDTLIFDPLGEYVDHAPPGSGEQGIVFCLSRVSMRWTSPTLPPLRATRSASLSRAMTVSLSRPPASSLRTSLRQPRLGVAKSKCW